MEKLVLVTALSLVLTACGGGGGSSAVNTQKSIALVPTELKSEVEKLKTITLDDGTVLNLSEKPTGYLEQRFNDGKIKGINGIYYTFGTWVPDGLEYNEHGLPTNDSLYGQQRAVAYITPKENIPFKGIAIYEGESLGAASRGKLRLEVDFNTDNVSGKIYNRRLDNGRTLADITLKNGVIVTYKEGGSGFKGDAEYFGVKGRFDGNFAGPKYEEVIGRVTKDGAIYVGFGGKRGELK